MESINPTLNPAGAKAYQRGIKQYQQRQENQEQKALIKEDVSMRDTQDVPPFLYLLGDAGTGKTTITNAMTDTLQGVGHHIVKLAPTNFANQLIQGSTYQSFVRGGFTPTDGKVILDKFSALLNGTQKLKGYHGASMFTIDEVSMIDSFAFDATIVCIICGFIAFELGSLGHIRPDQHETLNNIKHKIKEYIQQELKHQVNKDVKYIRQEFFEDIIELYNEPSHRYPVLPSFFITGDFGQLPPVLKSGEARLEYIIDNYHDQDNTIKVSYAFDSHIWKKARKLKLLEEVMLTKNYRLEKGGESKEFLRILIKSKEEELTDNEIETLNKNYMSSKEFDGYVTTLHEDKIEVPILLAPTNRDVNTHNNYMIRKIEKPVQHKFENKFTINSEEYVRYDENNKKSLLFTKEQRNNIMWCKKYLVEDGTRLREADDNSFYKGMIVPIVEEWKKKSHTTNEVVMVVGQQVIITANQAAEKLKEDPSNPDAYCNGMIGFYEGYECDDKGNISIFNVYVPANKCIKRVRYSYYTIDIDRYYNGKYEKTPIGKFRQVPLESGYAITIHKSQGQGFREMILDLGMGGCFTSNQAYVALSRSKDASRLLIIGKKISKEDFIIDERVVKYIKDIKSNCQV